MTPSRHASELQPRKWFSATSIRLLLAFASIIAFLLCQGLFSMIAMEHVVQVKDATLQEELLLHELVDEVAETRILAFQFLATREPAVMDRLYGELQGEMDQIVRKIRHVGMGADVVHALRDTYDEMARLHYNFYTRMAEDVLRNRAMQEYALLENTIEARGEKMVAASKERLAEEIRFASRVSWMISAVAVLAALAWAFALSRVFTDRARAEENLKKGNEQLEYRVRERTLELDRARKMAEAGSAAKSQFLANMSHEIRTPINAIVGFAGLALSESPDSRMAGLVRRIQSASEVLLGLINDILDFSKIEAGKFTLNREPFHLDEVLERLAGVVALQAAEKDLELRFAVGPEVPEKLVGDAFRLSQVLINIAGNAVKFTERGGIFLDVQIRSRMEGHAILVFEIADTGIGMTSEQADRMFKAFTQADPGTSRRYGGTGLGLSIAKRIVELMEGEIRVESAPGEGSRFVFHIRAGIQDVPAETALAGDGLEAVVVSTSMETEEILRALLTRNGAMVHVARNPETLIALNRSMRRDLVILDEGSFEAFGKKTLLDAAEGAVHVVGLVSCKTAGSDTLSDSGFDILLQKPVIPGGFVDSLPPSEPVRKRRTQPPLPNGRRKRRRPSRAFGYCLWKTTGSTGSLRKRFYQRWGS